MSIYLVRNKKDVFKTSQSVDKEAEVFKNFCLFACQKRVKFVENSVLL